MADTSSNKPSTEPIKVFRATGMSVAVFANTADDGRTFYKLTAQRIYRGGDNKFRTSNSFSVGELPQLILLLHRAWAFASDLEEDAKAPAEK
ncbi:hypothetical protein FYK55_26330 [Roseiconus nitratireducens]|uniref:Uncharacterized protein n=2 Tax=Roseiconus nitratireducens TaxID=2605748 RepID=A0A5M6CU93_9BACT|nr:hypothetical protein FYK55_26330 [Roseiconus nitratireducens]